LGKTFLLSQFRDFESEIGLIHNKLLSFVIPIIEILL